MRAWVVYIPLLLFPLALFAAPAKAPEFHVRGKLTHNGKPVAGAAVGVKELNLTTFTNDSGEFDLFPVKRGMYALAISHPKTKSETFDIFVKRDFVIEKKLSDEIPSLRSELIHPPFFSPTSASYDTGATVSKAVSVIGLSPQYYTFLPSTTKMGVLFEPPVVRAQNPMNNGYVTDGLVIDMPFHSLGLYGTTNLRYTDGVSVSRGVYSVTERDAQGAALIETHLPAGKEGRNALDFYANPFLVDAAAHYQISDKAWGTIAARRMIIDAYLAGSGIAMPVAIDYQGKNVYRLDDKRYLEVTFLGANDTIPIPGQSVSLGGFSHAQKLKYQQQAGQFVYEVSLKNRYASQNFVAISDKKNITSLHPQVGFYFAKDQFVQAGLDLYYEGRSASVLSSQGIPGVSIDQLKNYNVGGYDSGNGLAVGAHALYRGRFGKFGAEASARLDKYRDYDSLYSANALQLFYEFIPKGKIYVGGANMHRRADAYKSIALLSSPALAPESNYKAETGVAFNPFKFLKLQTTVFYTRWENIIALRNDSATATDITNTYIYRNAGHSENMGAEAAAILQFGKYYLRSSYTYQHMPSGDNYSFYYRRHVANAAFIYASERMSHTVQLKVWSLPTDIDASKSDALNPVVQLDYRWSIQSESGVFFMAEIGQILNIPYKYAAIPRRSEYNDVAALANSFLGSSTKATVGEELPIHFNLAAGLKL